jgi:hypothetical protein
MELPLPGKASGLELPQKSTHLIEHLNPMGQKNPVLSLIFVPF